MKQAIDWYAKVQIVFPKEKNKYDVNDLQNHFDHVIHMFSYYFLCVTFKNIYSP